ncbi:hypothetical protein KKB83_02460 [Patescibacteria group bacterium]|nr:hypothetical protein [Patescibacteria group bacterium]
MLNFKIKVSREANFFHLLSLMTQWTPFFKEEGKYWAKSVGPLSSIQGRTLEKLGTLLKKCDFGRNYLGQYFFNPQIESPWFSLKENFTPEEFQTVKESFDLFNPALNDIWERKKPYFTEWQKVLGDELKESVYEGIIDKLSQFFGQKLKPHGVYVYLLLSAGLDDLAGTDLSDCIPNGQKVISITGTYPNPTQKNGTDLITVLLHEVLHAEFQNSVEKLAADYLESIDSKSSQYQNLQKHARQENLEIEGLIAEILFQHLLPDGYIAQKHFGYQPTPGDYSDWRRQVITEGTVFVGHALESGKALNQDFLKVLLAKTMV